MCKNGKAAGLDPPDVWNAGNFSGSCNRVAGVPNDYRGIT